MSEEDAFRLWKACSLHFKTDSYCLKKYRARIPNLEKQFASLTSGEKAKLKVLSRVFPDKQEYCRMLVAAFMQGQNPLYIPISQCQQILKEADTRRQSMSYLLQKNNEVYESFSIKGMMGLLTLLSREEILPEYILVKDIFDNDLDKIYNDVMFLGWKETILRLRKYRLIFNAEKYHEKVFAASS
ncbi:hypothetical protein [Synechococcus phage BUCT-ZZ01]|nr:hypothetical protein [Synechococcus phage BUCT-ZZ01]